MYSGKAENGIKGKTGRHPFQQSVLLITCVPTFYIPREGIECHGIRLPPQPDTTPN